MNPLSRRNRPWAVPVVAATVIFSIGALANLIPAHADTPNLPTLTPAELLAKARTAQVGALSGTIELTSNLGLPSTSALSSSLGGSSTTSLATLLAGTHSAAVWMDGADHLRLATTQPLAETNWVRNGNDLWSYDSATLRATHATLSSTTESVDQPSANPEIQDPEKTPSQFAQELLNEVTPSTDVSVATPTYIDNRPVYELVLSPKDAGSTVKDAVISVDGATGVPLSVRIDAKSGSSPAFRFGFSKVSFDKPSPSIFNFTPPPGSTVVEAASPGELVNPAAEGHDRLRRQAPGTVAPDAKQQVTTIGEDWSTVAIVSGGSLPAQLTTLFNGAPTVKVGSQSGRVVTTNLVNAILLDDGRIAIAALTPDAMAAAIAAG
jgi:outer membrane lipoprotein-sorting protein